MIREGLRGGEVGAWKSLSLSIAHQMLNLGSKEYSEQPSVFRQPVWMWPWNLMLSLASGWVIPRGTQRAGWKINVRVEDRRIGIEKSFVWLWAMVWERDFWLGSGQDLGSWKKRFCCCTAVMKWWMFPGHCKKKIAMLVFVCFVVVFFFFFLK